MSSPVRAFPEHFFWGAATSAHQVEGGNRHNDWWRFEQQPGAIFEGHTSGEACRHYERFDEDFALAAADHHNAHRFSIEWSRIEPERGRIDRAAVEHYHAVLDSLRRHRMRPIVTLYHFTLPLWIADQGGWENRRTIERFCDFARFCAREYGGEVDWWCTVNEPEVLAFRGWSEGIWPPGKRNDTLALRVIAHLLEAHGRAYRILHDEDRIDADGDGHAARVGFAKHVVGLEADRPWFPLDRLRARLEDEVFNRAVLDAPITGTIHLSIPGASTISGHLPELAGSLDFIGINAYTRWRVRALSRVPHVARPGVPLTDLGWEVHPPALGEAVTRAAKLGVPVLVTEHGFADAADAFRPRALAESLGHLHAAIAGGADVIGYLHWSLLDNFEWADGYRGRFGLYRVDFDRAERPRRRTRSAGVLAGIAEANALGAELVAESG